MLPNFLLVGAMKSGTTSLALQMASHPEIFMSQPKEPHFFSNQWDRGTQWYESFFAAAAGAKAIGEASTTYTMFPVVQGVPGRIKQIIPNTRFLYMLRHPVERIISHYLHLWYENNALPMPLETLVDSDPQLLAFSNYAQQIEQFLPHFPLDRWHIIVTEEFAADPLPIHRRVYEFLGVDPSFRPADLTPQNVTADKVRPSLPARLAQRMPLLLSVARALLPRRVRHKAAKAGGDRTDKPVMSDALHNRILDSLMPGVQKLSNMLGRDFAAIWKLAPR